MVQPRGFIGPVIYSYLIGHCSNHSIIFFCFFRFIHSTIIHSTIKKISKCLKPSKISQILYEIDIKTTQFVLKKKIKLNKQCLNRLENFPFDHSQQLPKLKLYNLSLKAAQINQKPLILVTKDSTSVKCISNFAQNTPS